MKKVFSPISNVFSDVLDLVYPNICQGCGESLLKHERYICTNCLFSVPRTKFHRKRQNLVSELFFGKINFEFATAFCYFHKKGVLQNMIHSLKYKGVKEVGEVLGKEFATDLSKSMFENIDVIVPVPLHPKRERQRGYNQSEWIGIGLAEVLGKELDTTTIIRKVHTETQTKKNKEERWDNVKDIFKITDTKALENKHVLVIDDVITTGATIESCASKVLEAKNAKVSIASLGYASG